MTLQRIWWAHALVVATALGAVACGGTTTNKPPAAEPPASDSSETGPAERFSPDELASMEPIPNFEGVYQLHWTGPWTYAPSGRTFPVQASNLRRGMIMATEAPTLDVMAQYGRQGCRVTLYDFLPAEGLRPTDLVLLAEAERALTEMRAALPLVEWVEPELQQVDGFAFSMTGGISEDAGVRNREVAVVFGDERWLYKVRITSAEAEEEACLVDALYLLFAHLDAL